VYDAPTQPFPALEVPRSLLRPGVRERRLRAWRRALRRRDLPTPAVLVLTQRLLALQDAFGPDSGA